MAKRWWWLAVLALCAGVALAGGRGAVRKQIESTMLVEGTIDVNADGSVAAFDLKRRETLQPEVLQLIAQAVPSWRFKPLAPEPGTDRARADMSIRLVARKLDDGRILLGIRGAQFGRSAPDEQPGVHAMAPPLYPRSLAQQRVGGTVYVVVKITRDGLVDGAAVEQVNLRAISTEGMMRLWREQFAQTALAAARKWTFKPPTRGPAAAEPVWLARVPIDFVVCDPEESADCPVLNEYAWHAYVPGPRQRAPWGTDTPDSAVDAVASGGVHSMDPAFRLLTDLDAS